MRGRQILIEPLPAGGHAAALVVDGRLQDLLIDPDPADPAPRPEAVYRALPGRPMKGTGGVIVDLGGGIAGFLRAAKPPAPGRPLVVQVSGWAEPGKAAPVGARLRLKRRTAMLTPGAPGRNLARSLRDPDRRAALAALADAAMAGADPGLGLVLRTAAGDADGAGDRGGDRRAARRVDGNLGGGRPASPAAPRPRRRRGGAARVAAAGRRPARGADGARRGGDLGGGRGPRATRWCRSARAR